MSENKMPVTLRLTNDEQESLRKKCIEINKILIKNNRQPIKDSELAHLLLEKSMAYMAVSDKGDLILDV